MTTTWHEPQRDRTPAEVAYHHLIEMMVRQDRLNRDLERGVREARAWGYTWEQIGSAMGLTKQGAHQRFSGVEGFR